MQSQLALVVAFCCVGCAVAEPQQGQRSRPDMAAGIGGVGGDDMGDVVVPTGPTGPTEPRDLALAPVDMATTAPTPPLPGPDMATGTAPAGCSVAEHVVINEVKTGGTTSTLSDEFIELYNPCASQVDVGSWSLGHFASAGTSENLIGARLAAGTSIAGHGYLLIASTACGCSSKAVQTYPNGALAAAGGGIGLRDANGTLIDAMGYGDATNVFVEDKPAAAPAADGSVARHPNGVDSNHNQNDFAVTATPTPGAQNQ